MFSLVPEFLEFAFLMTVYLVAALFAATVAIRAHRWMKNEAKKREMEENEVVARFKARCAARAAARLV